LEDELKKIFTTEVDLIGSEGGVFEVVVDGKNIFSKKRLDRFPTDGEIVALMQGLAS
jgi:selenoprotein W-related protein